MSRDPLAATVLDLEVLDRIGGGGGGTVWSARLRGERESRFVVKVPEPGQESALRTEWLALYDVPSPLLPQPVAWQDAHGTEPPRLVMLRRPGAPLDRALDDAPVALVCEVVRQILRGLAALHAAHLVHGDLHPGNILLDVTAEGAAVSLLDLGLVQRPGTTVRGPGRLTFAAPDRLRGMVADPRDDLFSLAMSVWTSWGLPAPYADYPALLPEAGARPILPTLKGPNAKDKLRVLAVLATWLAADRDHRPDGAEPALRQWSALPGGESAEGQALAQDLEALARRPWRWRLADDGPTATAGQTQWLVGPHGSGRTGALAGLVEQARDAGRRCVYLLGAVAQEDDEAEPAPDLGALGDRTGAAVARLRRQFHKLREQLGPDAVVAVDGLEQLPEAWQQALAGHDEAQGPTRLAALAVAAVDLPVGAAGTAWRLPPATVDELAAVLQAPSGGRTWDAAVVARILAATGGLRAGLLDLAAALLRAGAVRTFADRVEPAGTDADVEQTLHEAMQRRHHFELPVGDDVDVLGHLVVAGRWVPGDGRVQALKHPKEFARLALVRQDSGGGWTLAGEGARRFLLEHLPPKAVSHAALVRATALQNADPDEAVRCEVLAAEWGGPMRPRGATVVPVLRRMLDRGETQRAVELAVGWRGAQGDQKDAETSAVLAALLRARVALGQFAQVDADLEHATPVQRHNPEVLLATAEGAFRRGDYPKCRDLAEQLLSTDDPTGGEGSRGRARVWRAFAATWQGDRAAAGEAVAQGRANAAIDAPKSLPVFDYLAGLGLYYAGDLDAADAVFAQLVDGGDPTLQAAATGGRGLVAHRRGYLVQAREHYDRARHLAEQAGDRPRALNMGMNAAVLDHEAGDPGRALEGYDRVVTSAQQLGNTGALSRALNNRGNLLALLGCDERAAADLAAALEALQQAGNAYLEGNVRCVLAELDRRRGHLTSAAAHLDRAEQTLRDAGAQSELLEIQLERGYLHLAHDEPERARELAVQVGDEAASLHSPELQARALGLLAAVQVDGRVAGAQAVPVATALAEARETLAAARQLAPTSKPLLQIALAAEHARVLAWGGDLAGARTVARDQLARLDRMGATLAATERLGFERAAAHAQMRMMLRLLAGLPEFTGGASLAAASGSSAALQAVLAINRRLGTERDLGHLLEIVMDAAVLLTGAERGFLLLDDAAETESDAPSSSRPSKPELRVAIARNLDRENLRKPAHKLSQSIALRVFNSGDRVLSTDAQADERFADQASIHAGSLRSILCVPLGWQGRTIGVLYVDNRFTSGAFTQDHAGVLEALADQAAIAIQSARLIAHERATAEALARSRAEVEQLNAQLRVQLADVASALDDAREDLAAQRAELARRSDYSQIRGESPRMYKLFRLMDRVRDHDFPVLILGESGTGKELVARAIHFTGKRKRGPFVAVNCGALPSNLLESELFGHVRGSFTGATVDRRGLFESAHCGTLLLDEVGDMPLDMQVKLLRVLQTGEIQRVGDSSVRKVDVRVVAATHRNLALMVEAGTFREDLMYRLRVVELEVPALRERVEDLPLLVEHFLAENRKAHVGQVERVSAAALSRLRQHPWPGNVRQLETLLKSACLFANGTTLDVADVEPLLTRERATPTEAPNPQDPGVLPHGWLMTASLEEIESAVIRARVAALGGNKRQAAESLGIDRSTLYNRLRGHTVS
jgi:serine/threonine-protein kinase PknK